MTPHSIGSIPSILEDGKLKPGIYKIQNIHTETYMDIEVHTREVCCRPTNDLEEGRGFWDIKRLGAGYTVQFVEPGKPEQFCSMMKKLGEAPLAVSPYPVAWRVEVVNDVEHRGFEYIRFFWGTAEWAWNVDHGSKANGTKVTPYIQGGDHLSKWIWKLISVKIDGKSEPPQTSSETFGSGSLPTYDDDSTPGQPSTRAVRVESEHDEFGTIVKEVTVVATTTTTYKKYRVEDA